VLGDYPDVFSVRPGCTNLIEHKLRLTDDTPCFQAPYRIPESLKDAVENDLLEMVRNDIIQFDETTSYCSPLIVVKKKDGGIRLVNNFINLNSKTVNEQYMMNNLSDLVSRLAGARSVTRMDIKQAFLQVPMEAESIKYTGFHPFCGSFTYKKMPMGLKCASATCQRLLNMLLRGTHRFTGSLIDDILIFSMEFDQHLKHLQEVLERLRQAPLTVNTKKCMFAANDILILGFQVCDGRVYPDQTKVSAVANWPVPPNKTQLKSFLGLTGFFRQFVPQYAKVACPLSELLGKNKPDKLTWGEAQQRAFDQLRTALMSKPVLRAPDMSKP